jgi:hypothetical protein
LAEDVLLAWESRRLSPSLREDLRSLLAATAGAGSWAVSYEVATGHGMRVFRCRAAELPDAVDDCVSRGGDGSGLILFCPLVATTCPEDSALPTSARAATARVDGRILALLGRCQLGSPPDAATPPGILKSLPIQLPPDYASFVAACDGAEGWVGTQYLQLYRAADLLPLHAAGRVADFLPGVIMIGGDGGGTGYGIRDSGEFLATPLIGMGLEPTEKMGWSFVEFLEELMRRA